MTLLDLSPFFYAPVDVGNVLPVAAATDAVASEYVGVRLAAL
ncbi:hypothetical protein [Candidatus Ichthyocystis sparus]|nr:hypothetical protein [Candidatus Ichthyocystis sparus]